MVKTINHARLSTSGCEARRCWRWYRVWVCVIWPDWRMLAGGIWRMFATDCHLLIVSSHSFPHLHLLLLLLHSSIVICSVILFNTFLPVTVHSYTGGPRKKAVSLFSTQRSTSVQQFWHWFIPKLLMHVNQTKILFSPVNENHCAKQASNFQHLNNCLTEFCLIAARMC